MVNTPDSSRQGYDTLEKFLCTNILFFCANAQFDVKLDHFILFSSQIELPIHQGFSIRLWL